MATEDKRDPVQPDEEEAVPFGTGHYVNKVNYLKLGLGKNAEASSEHATDVPAEVLEMAQEVQKLSLEIRRQIRESLRQQTADSGKERVVWPEAPANISSTDDFFEQVKEAVAKIWTKGVGPRIEGLCAEWIPMLQEKVAEAEDPSQINAMIAVLGNPALLEEKIRINQLGILEGMREVDLNIWEKLIAISSERQHTEMLLANRWIREMKPEVLQKLGVTRDELTLVPRLASFSGLFTDKAFLKQMELAEQPGGSSATPLSGTSGSEFLYDISEDEVATYGETFPVELLRVSRNLERIATHVETLLAAQKLPDTYKGLPGHLRTLAEAYSSPEKDPAKVDAAWQAARASVFNLAQEGCPIMIIPGNTPSVAGDANKTDVEIRVALRFTPNEGAKADFDAMRKAALKVNEANRSLLAEDQPIPDVLMSYMPFAYGPNRYYYTPAEEGGADEGIKHHYNVVGDVAEKNEIRYVMGMLGHEQIDMAEQKKASIIEVGLHEIGHTTMPVSDDAVGERIGQGPEADVIEEFKAETVGMRNFVQAYADKGEAIPADVARRQFLAKLGVQLDALDNKTSDRGSFGERYFWPGAAIVSALLKDGVMREEEGTYVVTDYVRGLKVVAGLGDQLLERFYLNAECTPDNVNKYVEDEVRVLAEDPALKRFREKLRTAKG